jgi:hypothetical protein
MTKDDYLNDHVPHRVNLLLTFRERFCPGAESPIDPETARDFYRCAKDMAFSMVRFFCEEMGIRLPRPAKANPKPSITTRPPAIYVIRPLDPATLSKDPRFADLEATLIAANRAVAHLNPEFVNHSFNGPDDCDRISAVTTWVEELIVDHIYGDKARYQAAMIRPANQMGRQVPTQELGKPRYFTPSGDIAFDRFRVWFSQFLDRLCFQRDAGFVIMLTALPLLERYLRGKSEIGSASLNDAFYRELILVLPELQDLVVAREFWTAFRNGLLHQSTMKRVPSAPVNSELNPDAALLRVDRRAGVTHFCVNPLRFGVKVLNTIEGDFATYRDAEPIAHKLPDVIAPTVSTNVGDPYSLTVIQGVKP